MISFLHSEGNGHVCVGVTFLDGASYSVISCFRLDGGQVHSDTGVSANRMVYYRFIRSDINRTGCAWTSHRIRLFLKYTRYAYY